MLLDVGSPEFAKPIQFIQSTPAYAAGSCGFPAGESNYPEGVSARGSSLG